MVVDRDEVFIGKDSVDLRLNRGDRGDEGPEGLPSGRDLGIVLDEVLGYQLVDNSEVADAHGGKQPLDDIAVGGGVGHDMVPFSKLVRVWRLITFTSRITLLWFCCGRGRGPNPRFVA